MADESMVRNLAAQAEAIWPQEQALFARYGLGAARVLDVGCDNHIGRKMFTLLTELGATDIAVDYAVVDTLRVPRDTFARIWEAWRDGYTDSIVQHTTVPREEVERRWREMIACVRDPRGYALWQVPVWTAAKST